MMNNIVVYAFTKYIKNLSLKFEFHDFMSHVIVLAFSLKLPNIFTNHLYDFFQYIIRCICVLS